MWLNKSMRDIKCLCYDKDVCVGCFLAIKCILCYFIKNCMKDIVRELIRAFYKLVLIYKLLSFLFGLIELKTDCALFGP